MERIAGVEEEMRNADNAQRQAIQGLFNQANHLGALVSKHLYPPNASNTSIICFSAEVASGSGLLPGDFDED